MNETQHFRRLMNAAVATPLVIMAFLATLLCAQIFQMLRSADVVESTDEVIATANEAQKLMLDRETGLRGYLIAGNSLYLQPYKDAELTLPRKLEKLADLVKANPTQSQLAQKIRNAYAEWVVEAESKKTLYENNGKYKEYYLTDKGKLKMDVERGLISAFVNEEERLRGVRYQASQRAARLTLYTTAGASLFMGGVLAIITRRRLLLLGTTYGAALDTERIARMEAEDARQVAAERAQEVETLNAELELRVQQRTAELEVTNRELEAFSYSVSHDLRAPLRSMDGFSAALTEDYGASFDAMGKNYLNRIRVNCQTMGEMIDGLLNLSRVTRSEMRRETVNLSAIANEIVQQLHERDPQRNVNTVVAGKIEAQGDGRLLRNVLENLLGNAWKFTARRDDAQIEFGEIQQRDGPVYFVRDNGAGFDMAYNEKLFGAFQRLHSVKEYEGTGIGLATVQRIIRRHGGRVWAESAVGQGATFYFTLPA